MGERFDMSDWEDVFFERDAAARLRAFIERRRGKAAESGTHRIHRAGPTHSKPESTMTVTPIDMRTDTDCLHCCVAMVLGMRYESVRDLDVGDLPRQLGRLSTWLEGRGFTMASVQATGEGELLHSFYDGPSNLWIAGGPTIRGTTHAVLYQGTGILHDPHASRAGLLSITSATFIYPINCP